MGMLFFVNDFLARLLSSVVSPHFTRKWRSYRAEQNPNLDFESMGPIEAQFVTLGQYDSSRALVFDYVQVVLV